jgi:hypothetical protein
VLPSGQKCHLLCKRHRASPLQRVQRLPERERTRYGDSRASSPFHKLRVAPSKGLEDTAPEAWRCKTAPLVCRDVARRERQARGAKRMVRNRYDVLRRLYAFPPSFLVTHPLPRRTGSWYDIVSRRAPLPGRHFFGLRARQPGAPPFSPDAIAVAVSIATGEGGTLRGKNLTESPFTTQ